MKNLYSIFLGLIFMCLTICANAQVEVDANGKLRILNPSGTSNFLSFIDSPEAFDIDIESGDMVFRPNGSTSSFALKLTDNANFPATFNGKVNLGDNVTGVILEADGAEALWYDANSYSWGFGKNWNYFADEILIGNGAGSAFTPLNSDGLSIDASKDIRMEGTGARYIRFTESGSQKAFMGHTGTNMFVRNQETGGDLYLDGEVDLYLQTNSQTRMTITDDGQIGIGTTNPLSDLHIEDNGEVAGIIVERADQNNYVNLLSGTTGNSFYFARAKRFSIVPSSAITSTTPNNANSLFMYGPNWSTGAQQGNTGLGTDAPNEKLHVNGKVKANMFVTTSDRRLKSDIEEFKYGLEEVRQLQPVSFAYNGRGGTTDGTQHIGLIAQELQAVAPELVEEFTHVTYEYDEDGTQREVGQEKFLQIRDSEVKFMLINSIKQMAAENEALKSQNDALDARLRVLEDLIKNSGDNSTNETDVIDEVNVSLDGNNEIASLAQNQPNPFNENTVINYFLPENATGAHMNIFSAEGKMIKTIRLNEIGEGRVNLRANGLAAGNYMYQLVTDGGVVGTKTMVLIK